MLAQSATRLDMPHLRLDRSGTVPWPDEKPHRAPAGGDRGLGAEHPDAPQRHFDKAIRVAAHTAILLSILAFVLYYCIWSPVRGQISGAMEAADVTTVAASLIQVRAPEISGVFVADRPLPPGTHVRQSERLGEVMAPSLLAKIQEALSLKEAYETQQLLISQQLATASSPQLQQEMREVTSRLAGASQELRRLDALRRQLVIRAPADGFIHQGLGQSMAVEPNNPILTSIYAPGSELMVKITAPLEAINALRGRSEIVVNFATADGKVQAIVRPISSSVQSFTKEIDGRKTEQRGTLLCTPVSMPPSVRQPGVYGKLD